MARIYTVAFEDIAVSAVQDLMSITGATGKVCRILGYHIGTSDGTLPASQQLALRCSHLNATVSAGTGGAAVTPRKMSQGDAAASFTARRNDTGKATTSGTKVTLRNSGAHIYAGEEYMFPKPPEVGPTDAWVLELLTAPAAPTKLSCTVTVEELG